jgi:hypothetical protein
VAEAVPIDLIILCHSMSTEECHRALTLAKTRWPRVQSVVLAWGAYGCEPKPSQQVIDAAQGPARLLETITELCMEASRNGPPANRTWSST